MNKVFKLLLVVVFALVLESCASSRSVTTTSHDVNLGKYNYIVLGNDQEGDAELNDIMMLVHNELADRFKIISASKASYLILQGEPVLAPSVNIKTEKWDGGHTYITITFDDYETNQRLVVVKSSGIGMSISHDQKLALKALKKELDNVFINK